MAVGLLCMLWWVNTLQVTPLVEPVKDIASCLFFVSIGECDSRGLGLHSSRPNVS